MAAALTATSSQADCPLGKCDGNGFVPIIDGKDRERYASCECRRLLVMKNKLKFAEIPEEFKELRIADFDISKYSGGGRKIAENVKKIAIAYINNFPKMQEMGKGLYLYGEIKGSGKTRMAVSVGNALIRQHNQSVHFVTTINLINEIKDTFDRSNKNMVKSGDAKEATFSKLLRAAKEVDVLILDDFGTEKPTSWVNEIFYSILNDRMTAKKITLFTSNCRVENLLHDHRLVNRIERMAIPIKFPNESVRSMLSRQENEEVMRILLGGHQDEDKN
jgi:DNA replication protein DnaC